MTPEDIVEATLDAGWEGVPVGPDSKVSLTRWNVREFTRKSLLHHVRRGGNFAVKAGKTKSGVTAVAIDRDSRKVDTWRFFQRHGLNRSNQMIETASGNWHAWFKLDREIDDLKTKVRMLVEGKKLAVDAKVSGYVLFPPSGLGTGRYGFRAGTGLKRPEELEPLPASVVELLQKKRKEVNTQPVIEVPEGRYGRYAEAALRRELHTVTTAEEGTRNDTLNRAAFSLGGLVAVGLLRREMVEAALVEAATAAGLGEREIIVTVRSGLTAGLKRPRRLPT